MMNHTEPVPDWEIQAIRTMAREYISFTENYMHEHIAQSRSDSINQITKMTQDVSLYLPADIADTEAQIKDCHECIALLHEEYTEGGMSFDVYKDELESEQRSLAVVENNLRNFQNALQAYPKFIEKEEAHLKDLDTRQGRHAEASKVLNAAIDKLEIPMTDEDFFEAYDDLVSAVHSVRTASGFWNMSHMPIAHQITKPLMGRLNGISIKRIGAKNLEREGNYTPENAYDQTIKLSTVSEILDRHPPEYLIQDMLPEKGVAVIAGQSGHMKSFLAICLSGYVAAGKHLGMQVVKQAGVVYMANEGQGGIGLRCAAWFQHNGLNDQYDFRLIDQTPNLMRPETVRPYIDAIENEDVSVGLIVLDTFSKATVGGEDNSTSDMARAIESAYILANHFEALVVLIDHVGKEPKRGVRGAYAKYANVDMVGMVTKSGSTVTLLTQKQKEGEDNLSFRFDIVQEVVRDKETLVLVPTQQFQPMNQPDFIRSQLSFSGQIRRIELQNAFVSYFGEKSKASFKTVLRRLISDGSVEEVGDMISLSR